MPEAGPVAALARDPRLDVLRGAALVTIFVNHVPGTLYESFTTRNVGFSDAAEGFVLMAGMSTGLAYGAAFRPGTALWPGIARLWARAWSIYLVQMVITALAFGIAAGLALWADLPGLLRLNGIDALFLQPLQTLVALPLLLHQLDYADILPLYALLLLVAPALLWLGWRAPRTLVVGAVALWVLAGEARLNLPTWPVPGGWFLSPASWQILFVLGLMTGLRLREGRRFVPVRRGLMALAAAIILGSILWRTVPAIGGAANELLWRLGQAGLPWVLTAFDKTWETAPRLVHALALAYLLSALPIIQRACTSRAARPLALMGRQSLAVFALGSVLAILFQGIKTRTGHDAALDGLMLGTGLALQFALAAIKERGRDRRPA